jgi:glycosyltransferase involved in cell wall biosynthesis
MSGDSLPLVSVVIPSFNHGQYISQAIGSVLDQDYPNLELIIVDDGSTDDTHQVLQEYVGRDRVKVFLNKDNRGQGARLNFAIDQASGSFICILPSDDWFLPGKIRRQVDRFAELPQEVGLIYTRGLNYLEAEDRYERDTEPALRGKVFSYILKNGNFIFPASTMIRRECFDQVRFNEGFVAEGEGAFVRISRYWDVDFVDDYLTVMRAHSYNTGSKTALQYREVVRWFTSVLDDPTLPQEILAERGYIIGRTHRIKGLEFLVDVGDRKSARTALVAAVRSHPRFALDARVTGGILLSLLPGGEKIAQRLSRKRA